MAFQVARVEDSGLRAQETPGGYHTCSSPRGLC